MTALVDTSADADHNTAYKPYVVYFSPDIIYVFYCDSLGPFGYGKSTNAGGTWSGFIEIAPADVKVYSIWYEQWTPYNLGPRVHCAWIDILTDDIHYRSLDLGTDTLGSDIVIQTTTNGVSTSKSQDVADISITLARGGNLYVSYWGNTSGGAEDNQFYRSEDGGATWAVRADVADGSAVDRVLLFPDNAADQNDILAMYWDLSADEISVKAYDDTANSWSEGTHATMASMTNGSAGKSQWGLAIDFLDGKAYVAAWNRTPATADAGLTVWKVGGTADITRLNNDVTLLVGTSSFTDVLWDAQHDEVWVFNLQMVGDVSTRRSVWGSKSDDKGATWGPWYNFGGFDDLRTQGSDNLIHGGGGGIANVAFNDDTSDIEFYPSIPIPAGPGGGKADYLAQGVLDEVFENTNFVELANVWVALFNTFPEKDGSGTEVTGTGYARVSTAVGDWSRSGQTISNDNAVDFPAVGAGAWGDIWGFAIFDASTNGNMLYYGLLTPFVPIESDTVSFGVGALTIKER